MDRAHINGAELEYEVRGSGEAVLLVHGSVLAEAFRPLLAERALAGYQLIHFHRCGYAGSSRPLGPMSISDQAADCAALLRHLGIAKAHIAGHSYGGAIALQMAISYAGLAHSLVLMEPAMLTAAPSAAEFHAQLAPIYSAYLAGDKAGAIDAFLKAVNGSDYKKNISAHMPADVFEQAVADADTFFQVEIPAVQSWIFTREDAKKITTPILAVAGEATARICWESHAMIIDWLPKSETLVLSGLTHALQMQDPKAVTEGLHAFFVSHPMAKAAARSFAENRR